ncbi:hypothetical protein MFLAVUS_010188 [Mucor flavus]|uniref:Uncharacterized protein n=1 Tax=Mucor flavus TaxID=439312 RepID=A0ABP9ZC13_9FUNG
MMRDGSISGKSSLGESVKKYRRIIEKYKDTYYSNASYIPPKLVNSQQIELYECNKIHTAYLNNIKAHFGNRLNMSLNHICNQKEKANILRKRLEAEGYNKDVIQNKVGKEVLEPCKQIKLSVSKKKMPTTMELNNVSKEKIQAILSMIQYTTITMRINEIEKFLLFPDKNLFHTFNKKPSKDKLDIWGQAVDLKKKAFQK